jgi:hypothetical protein
MARLIGYEKVHSSGEYAVFCKCVFTNNYGYGEKSYVEIKYVVEHYDEIVKSFVSFDEAIRFIENNQN